MQAHTKPTADPAGRCHDCPERQGLLEDYLRGLVDTAVACRADAIRWRRVATLAAAVLLVVVVLAILNGCASSSVAKPEAVARVAAWDNGAAEALEVAGETAWDVILRCTRAPGCEYTGHDGRVWEVVDVRRWRGREDVVELEVTGGRSPFGVHASRFDMIRPRAPADTTAAR